jgi:hypothetical protein
VRGIMKKIKMFVCVGNTTHYKEIFEKVLEEFVDRFEKEGIIGEYSVFSQTDIEATCDDIISKKLSESQLVLFITEEQGHEIEESMKIFLQNVSLWCYTMPMVGKLGILVSVCNEKELLITTNYMTKLLLAWGSGIVGKLIFQNGISVEAELEEQIGVIAEKIKKICDGVSFKVTEAQKKNFEINKKMISDLDDSEYLKQYWEKNMYLEAKDFQYLFDSKFLA